MTAFVWVIAAIVVLLILGLGACALFTARTARQVEQAVPPLGRFIEIDGVRLHYVDQGSGPPLLLIHGLGGQMRHFTHSLLGKLKDYRVVILDRPGSGYSTRPAEASAAIDAQARTIARFAAAVGLVRPIVVGHSLGGAISLALALNHPEQVAGLVLLAPLTHPQHEVPPIFRPLLIRSSLLRSLVAWTLAVPFAIRNGTAVVDTVFAPAPAPADFPTKAGGLLALRPSSFITASRDLVAVPEYLAGMPARYGSLTVPLGILFGTDDQLLDASAHGQALAAKVPSAELELIEGEGHMVPISSADRSAAIIRRVAQRASASAQPAVAS